MTPPRELIAPGRLISVGGIRTTIINDHHEAFYWWWDSQLKDTTLFHVDGHSDMKKAYVDYEINSAEQYQMLNIANFICPAAYHGIVSDVYWLNPHSEERRLLYYNKPKTFFSESDACSKGNYKYDWDYLDAQRINTGNGMIVPLDEIYIPEGSSLILDIDLDAFCCHRKETLSFLPLRKEDYEGVLGFEGRIDQTIKALAQLPRPQLITIASSQGDVENNCYVPPLIVDEVERYLTLHLQKLYQ